MFFKFKKLTSKFIAETLKESINIYFDTFSEEKDNINIYNSKIGGVPYLPKDFNFNKNKDGKYLSFFAQINLSELPENNIFDLNKGILSFWLDPHSYSYGNYFDENNSFSNYKIIYFENIEKVLEKDIRKKINDLKIEKLDFLNNNSFKMEFLPGYDTMHYTDYKFDQFLENLKEEFKLNNLSEKQEDKIYNLNRNESKIGGNPVFVQSDFRTNEEFNDYEIDLFQYFSLPEALVGDGGIMHFFIKEKDLKNKDFSKVIFYWDCY